MTLGGAAVTFPMGPAGPMTDVTQIRSGGLEAEPPVLAEAYPTAQGLNSFDGFVADTDRASTTQDGKILISVRPDGTLGREDVTDGGLIDTTDGARGAAQENPIRIVEM